MAASGTATAMPANPDAGGKGQCPARKLSKEKLLSDDPIERHVGTTLVYMGGRSKFCLMQCVSIDDDRADERCDCNLDDEDDSADERNGCHLEE
ncbi:uncharacterized protein C2845_PM07G11440 [Panicum miliaceum]|uniref:Uncharacterized protein n=1 Tax=Panicum miliaceum TaxID=4540 RepID=A0A3L6SJQ4_PANMI|nr:uncharacterized protein C2845_PM07G11440 [Panicum miliaceum]